MNCKRLIVALIGLLAVNSAAYATEPMPTPLPLPSAPPSTPPKKEVTLPKVDLPSSPKPSAPNLLRVWDECVALTKSEGRPHAYVEGTLVSSKWLSAPIEPIRPPFDIGHYSLVFDIQEPTRRLELSLGGARGKSKIDAVNPDIIEGKKYGFCISYSQGFYEQGMISYYTKRIEPMEESSAPLTPPLTPEQLQQMLRETGATEKPRPVPPPPMTSSPSSVNKKKEVELPKFSVPADPRRKGLWDHCQELTREKKKPYQYAEGKLLGKTFYRERDIGDCFPVPGMACRTFDEKTERAWYDLLFDVAGVKVNISIQETTHEMKKLDPILVTEKNYSFCVYRWVRNGSSGYSIDRSDILKQED